MNTSEQPSAKLTAITERFVLHWGEMGARWGMNRTIAQVHALLFVSERPMHAQEIAESLAVARSNVSTSLRELLNWELIRVIHLKSDRREHFEAITDVWELFRRVAAERKRREIDPTVQLLEKSLHDLEQLKGPVEDVVRTRLAEMLEFLQGISSAYGHLDGMSSKTIKRMLSLDKNMEKIFRSFV